VNGVVEARPTTLCWRCGRVLGHSGLALQGAPWPLYLHLACLVPTARRLLAAWRQTLIAAEYRE
jgi:hypothetical protein